MTRNALDWDAIPRILHDLCDGHPGRSVELYRLDRSWFCKNCFVREWEAAGFPPVGEAPVAAEVKP